jgi:hypothetical protein
VNPTDFTHSGVHPHVRGCCAHIVQQSNIIIYITHLRHLLMCFVEYFNLSVNIIVVKKKKTKNKTKYKK